MAVAAEAELSWEVEEEGELFCNQAVEEDDSADGGGEVAGGGACPLLREESERELGAVEEDEAAEEEVGMEGGSGVFDKRWMSGFWLRTGSPRRNSTAA